MNAMIVESGKTDYLTMMSAPDHATLTSSHHDYVNTPGSEGAPNSASTSSGCQIDKSLISSPKSELPSSESDLKDTFDLSAVKQTNEIISTKQFNAEQIDSKSNDCISSIIYTPDNCINVLKQNSDLRKNMSDSFDNSSYMMQNNREIDQTI